MNVAIAGAGELGGLVAHVLARRNLARTIQLIDDNAGIAAGKALDIAQAAPVEGSSAVVAGSADVAKVGGAAIVVLADKADGPAMNLLRHFSVDTERVKTSLLQKISDKSP